PRGAGTALDYAYQLAAAILTGAAGRARAGLLGDLAHTAAIVVICDRHDHRVGNRLGRLKRVPARSGHGEQRDLLPRRGAVRGRLPPLPRHRYGLRSAAEPRVA